jgi:hypothetical protein
MAEKEMRWLVKLSIRELWWDEPAQHASQWRGLKVDERDASLRHFRVRSRKLKNRPSEIGLMSDHHEAFAGKGLKDFSEPGGIEAWAQQWFHADFCV